MHLEMDISVAQYVAFYGVILVIGWLLHWVYRWINPVCNGVLPPGSMGVPIIGETFDFLKASSSLDIPDFYKQRMKRYLLNEWRRCTVLVFVVILSFANKRARSGSSTQ